MKKGLTSSEVEQQIKDGNSNSITKHITRSYQEIIRSNLLTYFNLVNLVLFVVVLLTGQYKNGLFFGTAVFNTCIGIFQQIRSKKLLDRLSLLTVDSVDVLRDEQWQTIRIDELVLNDYIRLQIGNQVPADAEIVSGHLELNESVITGESDIVRKGIGAHVYGGTAVTAGQAELRVIRVGEHSVANEIINEAQQEKYASSVLHEELEKMIRVVSVIIVPVGIILYLVQKRYIGLIASEAALKTVAAVVGMIPEGLVVLTSVSLALSAMRLGRIKVLVQDLFAIEALARVDLICLDKTGTLTTGNLKVKDVICPRLTKQEFSRIMGSYLQGTRGFNATNAALLEYFGENTAYHREDVIDFSSVRKYGCSYLESIGYVYVGAAGYLFENETECDEQIRAYSQSGYRVLCVGFSHSTPQNDMVTEDLSLLGIIVMEDELRENMPETLDYFRKQGIAMKILTGDDPATAASIAIRAGVKETPKMIDYSRYQGSAADAIERYNIFGRVMPADKMELIKAYQQKGYTTAMVGDGVNDLAALKSADVSVSFGSASASAKDISNLILLEDDFARMPQMIHEGRRVINNISRAATMYLVKTTFSILLSLYVIGLRQMYPFLPIHLTLISMFTVGIPTTLLQLEPSFEKSEKSFFLKALSRAVPSGISVFIAAMVCVMLKEQFSLAYTEFYGIFVGYTAIIYFYTLVRVYQPFSRYRVLVIGTMAVLFTLSLRFLDRLVQVSYPAETFLYIGIGIVGLPLLVEVVRYMYILVEKMIHRKERA